MHKLFSCLYGSQLYGINTANSDRDVKYIVLPDFKDVLLGKQIKNKVKKTTGDQEKSNSQSIDEEFIPIQVFARDFMEGQTYALELAYAVDYTEAEQQIFHGQFKEFCHQLREKFLTKNIKAMVGYAMNQAVIYSNKGERLNAVTELYETLLALGLSYITEEQQKLNISPLMSNYWDVVKDKVQELSIKYPKYIKIDTYAIDAMEGMRRPCIKILEKILPYNITFDTALNTINATKKKYGMRAKRTATEDEVDWKATSHALRIINEGITLLSGGKLIYPYEKPYAEWLKKVKLGQEDYDEVMSKINNQMEWLTDLQAISELPDLSHELDLQLQDWLYEWLLVFYEHFDGVKIHTI